MTKESIVSILEFKNIHKLEIAENTKLELKSMSHEPINDIIIVS